MAWFARGYDRMLAAAEWSALAAWRARLLRGLRGRVLEIGAGTGVNLQYYPEDLDEFVLSEPDPDMRAVLAAKHPHARIEDWPAEHLPAPDGHFDAVLSSGSIKHWPEQVAGLREIHRVLAPGGRAFIGEMNRLAPPTAIATQRARLRHWLFRLIYPRVFAKAMSPDEARAVFAASPFGAPVRERMLLDGIFWLFEAVKRTS